MYNNPNVLGDSTTVASGTASLLGGAAVLPNTGGNLMLQVLSIATLSLGVVILVSFVVTRVLARRFAK